MGDKRNALVDITRVAAAVGIILSHVDLTGYGMVGALFGQFLSVRFSLMFFLAIIGFHAEKSYQAGKNPVPGRVRSLARVYGVWSVVYFALSFVMVVLLQRGPLGQFLVSKVKGFLFSGSYYHFWFYPAVIYSLLFIGAAKKLLGHRALSLLMPLALLLYAVGLLGTGYLPIGQKIPGLRTLYGAETFEAVMHLCFLGFPSIVFGMAAAQKNRVCSGLWVLLAAAVYAAESGMLCLHLGWREDPQMLLSTPLLTAAFLHWIQNRSLPAGKVNCSLLRVVSASMYNVHPLFLAAFAVILPGLDGLWAFSLCVLCSAFCGWVLYYLRKKSILCVVYLKEGCSMERKTNVNMVMFDFAKGLAMLAVVFIHSGAAADYDTYPVVLIRSVVVAVFFMASGFWLRKRKLKTGIRLAAEQLLIPYAVTLGIILVVGFVHRLLTRDLRDYLDLFLLPVLKRGAGPRTGALWFLVATFQTWCMYYLLMRLKDARLRFVLVILGAVIGMGLLPLHDYTYLIPQSLLMLPYIYGGNWIREKGLFDRKVPAWLLVVLSIPALVLAAFGKIDVIMDVADFGLLNIAAQLLFGYVLIYVTLLINAKEWKWTEWIMEIGRHSLWVLCIHSIEMSVFPWSVLWRFVEPESVAGILTHFALRSLGILIGCLALRRGQGLLRKWKKQHSIKKNG